MQALEQAELDEKQLSVSNNLSHDAVDASGSEENILKISFVFLLRRLAVCSGSVSTRSHLKLEVFDESCPRDTVLFVITNFGNTKPSDHMFVLLGSVYFNTTR